MKSWGDLPQHRAVSVQRLRHRDGARTYFDKSADKLNLLESATLIGMLKGTAYYNPVTQPERSAGAAQHRAGANGQARQAGGVQAGGPAKAPAAH